MRKGKIVMGQTSDMIDEQRNRHVKKLLEHLGGRSVPPYLQKAIKRAFSEFSEDIKKDIDNEQKSIAN